MVDETYRELARRGFLLPATYTRFMGQIQEGNLNAIQVELEGSLEGFLCGRGEDFFEARILWFDLPGYVSPSRIDTAIYNALRWLDQTHSANPNGADVDIFQYLLDREPSLKGLRSLNLSSFRLLTDAGMRSLSKLTNLELLDMSKTGGVSDTWVEALANLTNLTHLDLSYCRNFSDKGILALSGLHGLKYLNVGLEKGCGRTEEWVEALSKLTSLEYLNLAGFEVTNDGMKNLQGLTSLTELDLSRCSRVSDQGLVSLSKLPLLHTLDIRFLEITDTGLQTLSSILSLRDLTIMFAKKITDAGILVLSALTSLVTLTISDCEKVTIQGLTHLSTMLPETVLQR
jgi:hypothetical protein